jgi:uncharacterized membrane protein
MNKYTVVVASILFIVVANILFLRFNKSLYTKQIIKIQRVIKTTNWTAYLFAQFFIITGYCVFVINYNGTPIDAFIYGLCVYGYYHCINMSAFKHWQLRTVLVDTTWGAFLFYLTRLLIH